METPYLAAPFPPTPAVCALSNHGGPLTTSPGLPISRWCYRISPILSQHCASGIGASSPVHAAVEAPRSDWTALSETSSAEHPCRHDNLPVSQHGVCLRRGGVAGHVSRRLLDWLETAIYSSWIRRPALGPSGVSLSAQSAISDSLSAVLSHFESLRPAAPSGRLSPVFLTTGCQISLNWWPGSFLRHVTFRNNSFQVQLSPTSKGFY